MEAVGESTAVELRQVDTALTGKNNEALAVLVAVATADACQHQATYKPDKRITHPKRLSTPLTMPLPILKMLPRLSASELGS